MSPQTVDSNWYYLRISYRDKTGAMQTGYPYESTDTYWANYMIIRPGGPSPIRSGSGKLKQLLTLTGGNGTSGRPATVNSCWFEVKVG